MPSAESVHPELSLELDDYAAVLLDFKRRIELCLADTAWDELPAILASRQAYLERIASQPIPDERREWVKQIALSTLADDAEFLSKVEADKSAMAKQQQSLERGIRATQAYKNT
ncbi:flagellar protein FliT [Methylomonas sp. SURF-1]|uniref:Flagellar protein FliT n=1 Tax=Methylomonas aurea TaxID=2952224 RepID=A0ABT1UIL5_9GAMM|nr:flagellar protein FliT [Methylomonas sp. SURF-1]MCQ8182087.1 flagellar protein FliT [Methylomonas sp. SURF-1]